VADEKGTQRVLKIHRLGRISFRTVKANRDYLRNRSSGSWMYLSRLAALKEYAFMKALFEHGFPVPTPLAQSRHTIVMSLINAFPLRQISKVPDPSSLYADLISLILKLAKYGLIHGDFNEFNILILENQIQPDSKRQDADSSCPSDATLTPILIDFPQMLSIDHPDAEMYFNRDVNCIKRFFERRFQFTSSESGPFLSNARKQVGKNGSKRLDVEVEASGFSRKMAKELETYMKEVGVDGDRSSISRTEVASEGEGEGESEDEGEGEDEGEDEDYEDGGDGPAGVAEETEESQYQVCMASPSQTRPGNMEGAVQEQVDQMGKTAEAVPAAEISSSMTDNNSQTVQTSDVPSISGLTLGEDL
jgi:RIO kinase 2